jgi:hypothetical protein
MIFLMFFAVSSVNVTPGGGPGEVGTATAGLEKDIAKAKIKLAKAEAKLAAARAKGESANVAQADAEGARSQVNEQEVALRAITAAVADKDSVGADGTPVHSTSITTGHSRLDAAIRQAIKNPEFTLYKIKNAASKFSFLLVPLSLPFLWLMFFWKRGVTMYDHAVFALYSLSFMALLVTVLTLLEKAGLNTMVAWIACIAPPLHMFLQLRGTYSLGTASTLWRTLALLFVSLTVLVMYLLLVLYMSVT